MKILVLHGGTSNERAVSLRSGKATATALQAKGHDVTLHDHASESIHSSLLKDFDVIFPVLHGTYGEDGALQKQLESHQVPFVGSDSTASNLCFDKQKYRDFLSQHNVRIPNGRTLTHKDYSTDPMIVKPHVVKPIDGGSSLDTFIVTDPHNPPAGITDTFDRYGNLLVEELVLGTEITVGVLGDSALPVIEIIPPEGSTFDYTNKYNGATQELCPPLNVSHKDQQAAQQLAEMIHKLTNCSNYSRTDMIVTTEGDIVILETNTAPGMTDQSLFPKAAHTAGLPMDDLCDALVRLALTQ